MYVGLFVGALFWGLTADIIGRRFAFNVTLLFGSIFAMIAGAAPNWMSLGFFISASAFGFGGNLILDTTIFLEYLPSGKQWVLTLLAAWWGVGNVIVGLIAWAFMSNYACVDTTTCTKADNMGWRYVCFTSGALVLVMSITRLLVIRLKETPKYLLGQNKDAEVVAVFQLLAHKYNRPCSLTEDQLRACGRIQTSKANSALSIGELKVHIKGLFMTKEMALSTCLIWISWILVGLAFPLYYVFLPEYLKSRGAKFGSDSNYTTWRNYAIVNICGGCAPILAGLICELPRVGRRGTMAFGALAGMAFFFAYTTVRSPAENLGFNCGINFFLNVYYSCLYAYTPEVLPSAHRATGTSISVAFNRIMGMLSGMSSGKMQFEVKIVADMLLQLLLPRSLIRARTFLFIFVHPSSLSLQQSAWPSHLSQRADVLLSGFGCWLRC